MTARARQRSHPDTGSSPQPNVLGSGSLRALPPLFWALVVATGAGAGVAGGLLMMLLHLVQHWAWPYQAGDDFLKATEHASAVRTVAVVTLGGVLAAVVRWLLQQETGGGHGGELAQAIWFDAGRLAPLRTGVRAVLSIVIVGLGASLGREAAPKQAGALIASLLGGWARMPDGQRRLLAACGAGAGIAAVYNVPFGGAIFALEVLLGTVSLPLVPPALAASLTATAVSRLFLPDVATYDIPFYPTDFGLIAWAVLAGPVAGVVSVAYVRLISRVDRLHPGGAAAFVVPILVFAVLGVIGIGFPQVLGNGKDLAQQTFSGALPVSLLLALVVLKPLVTAACLGSGAPGGLFTPTVTLGAVLGSLLGQGWQWIWPQASPGSFALIGATAVLAASTQGPISAVVLVIELTRRLDTLMVPVILAVAAAVLVARLLEARSIYSGRIHLGRSAAGRATATAGAPVFIAISAAAHHAELLEKALSAVAENRPIHVIDADGGLVGEVSLDRLQAPTPDLLPLETATAADFARPVAASPVQRLRV